MNAGPDVERSIAQWLVEESPGRAPDRILENAGSAIDRTKQRRFAVAWREPVTISMRGLALAAALVVIVVIGAGFVGRSTASVGVQATPTPAATPQASASAPQVTLVAYRAARDAVCTANWAERNAIDARIGGDFFHPVTPAKIAAQRDMADFRHRIADALDALEVPPSMIADEAASIARYRDTAAIIDQEVVLLDQGKYAEAETADLATAPLSQGIESFERQYGLQPCP